MAVKTPEQEVVTDVKKPDHVVYKKTKFKHIDLWAVDNHKKALHVFLRSCKKWRSLPKDSEMGVGGTIQDWLDICDTAKKIKSRSSDVYRTFFEKFFTPYQLISNGKDSGLFTGYYEILLNGSKTKGGIYQHPLYQRPDNLVQLNIRDFFPELDDKTIYGLVEGNRIVPIPNRKDIEQGALNSLKPLLYLSDPVDGFFLHIQGSGKVMMDKGGMLNVGYAGKNGKPYTAVGKVLYEDGRLDRSQLNAIAIRKWLKENPELAKDYMHQNESFIFFRKLPDDIDGPIGSQGVPLTPRRSLAVDRRYVSLGVPVWVDVDLSDQTLAETRFTGLMIAQDTGSAIKGGIRGDIFFGFGKYAELMASNFKQSGNMYILLPKNVSIQ